MLRRLCACLVALGLVAGCVSGCCAPSVSESLPVTLHPQETGVWCWAASGQMVMDFLGHDVSQCVQANNQFGRSDCCGSLTPAGCVNTGWPEFQKYGFTFNRTSSAPLSWLDLKSQISTSPMCDKKPFCFTWEHDGGGGHMMVAIGYNTVGTTTWVEANDPWPPNVGDHWWITYQAYVAPPGKTHWDDFYDVTYTGGQ